MCAKKTAALLSGARSVDANRREFLRTASAAAFAPLAGGLTALSPTAIAGDHAPTVPEVAGTVLSKADEYYEIGRQALTWQTRKSTHRPNLIIQAESVEDIVVAIKHARNTGLKVAVRTGGHSWVNSSIRNDSLLLDLGKFRSLSIDPDARSALVGPAVIARDFLRELREHNLVFPVAHCGSVPLGGFLLGGGLGYNYQSWGGMSCYCIRGIEVVTADGEVIYADEKQNSDYLWAARGGGPGFFGVVTRFYLDVFPLPKMVSLSTYSWPLAYAGPVGDWMSKNFEVLPNQVEMQGVLLTDPDSPAGRCDPNGKTCAVYAYGFYDTIEESREALAPLMSSVPAAAQVTKNELQPSSIEVLIKAIDDTWLPARFEADNLWSDESLGKIGSLLKDHFSCAPSPQSAVLFEPGRRNKRFPGAAFSMWGRSIGFLYAIWNDPADDQKNFDWVAEGMDLIKPLGKGHFISETNLLAGRARGSYSTESWDRLQALRARHDPHGLFHSYLKSGDVV